MRGRRHRGEYHAGILGLEEEILEKIYHKNFERIVGTQPKALNYTMLLEEVEAIDRHLIELGIADKNNFAKAVLSFLDEDSETWRKSSQSVQSGHEG